MAMYKFLNEDYEDQSVIHSLRGLIMSLLDWGVECNETDIYGA